MARDLWHDLAPYPCIRLQTLKPGLSGLLLGARRQDGDGRPRAIGIISGPDARRVGEGHSMVEVHRLALRLGSVGIDEHDLCGKTAQNQSIGKRGSHIAHADNGHSNWTRFLDWIDLRHAKSFGRFCASFIANWAG
jgi:hypothetical protein